MIFIESIETDLINLLDKTNSFFKVKKPSVVKIKYFTFQTLH